jgi:hypothetical protein
MVLSFTVRALVCKIVHVFVYPFSFYLMYTDGPLGGTKRPEREGNHVCLLCFFMWYTRAYTISLLSYAPGRTPLDE